MFDDVWFGICGSLAGKFQVSVFHVQSGHDIGGSHAGRFHVSVFLDQSGDDDYGGHPGHPSKFHVFDTGNQTGGLFTLVVGIAVTISAS